jgi:hypothetical protein
VAVPFHSLGSLQAFKRRGGVTATSNANDAKAEELIGSASAIVERYCGAHFMFRGVRESDDGIVADVAITNTSLTLAAQPNSAGRALRVIVTDADRQLTAGRLTITGTNLSDAVISDVIEFNRFEAGLKVSTTNVYKTVASAVISSAAGNVAATKIKIGTALPFVEYHTVEAGTDTVFLRYRHVLEILEVNEDANRVYGSGTRLTPDTQYVLDKRRGRLTRVGGSATQDFLYGFRVLRVTYTAGFQSDALRSFVPDELADVAIELAILKYRQSERGLQGVSSVSDASGTVTRFSTGDLTDRMKDQLEPFRRSAYKGVQTWNMDDGPL